MGVKQWLFQRLSNLVFVVFGLWLLIQLVGGSEDTTLGGLLSSGGNQLFLAVCLFLACLNSVLASWQIAGDYAHKINVNLWLPVGLCTLITAVYAFIGFGLLF